MKLGHFAIFAAVLAVMQGWGTLAYGQYRGSLQGTVTDAQGAVVPSATVTLVDKETKRTLTAETNDSGVYSISALPPSRYTLTVEKGGFKRKELEDLGILAEQANSLNIVLEVGQVSETMTVNADAPLIDAETASISATVTAQEAENLPAFGRDVFQLVQLAPGAFGDGSQAAGGGTNNLPSLSISGPGNATGIFAIENSPQISVAGGRHEVNNFQIDGVGVTSVTWGGTSVITPNLDSIKEVKVVTSNYDVEDGRYGGGQVKVITKNGTNQYHGSLFFKADRPGLNAYQSYNGPGNAVQRDEARFNDLGGTVGAPIIHNRLFGFFAYETIRDRGDSLTESWFETASYRQAATAGSAAAAIMGYNGVGPVPGEVLNKTCADVGLIDIAGSNPAAGVYATCNEIPGQGLDLGRPLDQVRFPLGIRDPSHEDNVNGTMPGLGGDGTGGNAQNTNLDGIADLQFVSAKFPHFTINQQFNGRLDLNATSSDLIAFTLFWVPSVSKDFNGTFRPMNYFVNKSENKAGTALWNHTFSSTLQNEFRGNVAGWRWFSLKDNPNAPFGLPTVEVAPNDGTAIGPSTFPNGFGVGPPAEFNQWTYAGKDILTKVYRSHTMKMGGETTRLLCVDAAPWNGRPDYNFNNMWDLLNDAPIKENATFNPLTGVPTDFRKDTRSTLYSLFFQDSYKSGPNLTLNAGLRWEYSGPLSEKKGNMGVVILGQGARAITDVRVRKGGNVYQSDYDDFGPQLGFAWSPEHFRSRLVVRGGFGLGFTATQEANTLDGRSNPPFVSPAFNLPACPDPPACTQPSQIEYGVNTFPADPHSFYGYASNPFAIAKFDPTTNLPLPGPNFSLLTLQAYEARWPTTRTYRYSLESQYDLGREWVATLGYQGTASRHLTRQYNFILYEYGEHKLGLAAFNPVLNGFMMYDNEGRGNFNALLLELRHRFGSGFEFDTQYRWAKSMDTGSSNYSPAGMPIGSYVYTLEHEYGPSDYDVTHAFKAIGIWAPRLFRGDRGYLEKSLGGWSLSGILNAHSGFPWTPVYSGTNDAVYQGSDGGWLRPASYVGRFTDGHSNSDFIKQNYRNGAVSIFPAPSYTPGPTINEIIAGTSLPGPIPGSPGIGRNSFRGPRYFDVDATLGKSFGLPTMMVLGEHAKFEIQANFYNLFNKLNLTNVQNIITDPHFGQALGALGSRTIEMQAKFNF